MASEPNSYCARLSLPVPRVEDFVGSRQIKLFDLLVVALLERGQPTSLEEIATHLLAAGAEAATGDMVHSLKKAWHGMEPVYREPDGRMGLNLSSSDLDLRLFQLGLRGPRVEPLPLPPEPEPVPDDVPLTEAEIRWAFAHSSIHNVSTLRQAAAILDACAQPTSIEALGAYLVDVTSKRLRLSEADTRRWGKSYVRVDAEGRLWLDRTAPGVPAMRRAIRKLSRSVQVREAREEHWKHVSQERQAVLARERQQAQREAARLRRAVLRVLPEGGPAEAAALLDVGAHVVHTFFGNELAELPALLDSFDVVAALRVRESLHALGVCDQDRFRLADLKPPQKTRRLNRQGRTLTITPELLITSTTGISRPLGESAKIAAYLAAGSVAKLRRRIASDVKALFAFYNYGVLHGYVRLRWGFLDEVLPIDWAVPGDRHLYDILKACCETGSAVDLVWGSAPGWTDPWSRARRLTVVSLGPWSVLVASENQQWELPRQDIQAVRPATGVFGGNSFDGKSEFPPSDI